MQTRLLVSVLMIGVASATAGAGLFALFSDTAVSTNNVFTAGTLALTAGGVESLGAFIEGSNVKPGHLATGSVLLQNAGSLTGSAFDLDIGLDVAQSHADFTKFWEITSITYGGDALTLADANGNGWIDINDLDVNNAGVTDLADPGALGKTLAFDLKFREDAGNELQGASASLAFTFFLAQVEEVDFVA